MYISMSNVISDRIYDDKEGWRDESWTAYVKQK